MLPKIVKDLGLEENIKILTCAGAGYCRASLQAKTVISYFQPTLIIMLLGICEITRRDRRTRYTQLRMNSAQQIVEHVMLQARMSLGILRQYGSQQVSYATITGLDLQRYNLNAIRSNPQLKDLLRSQQQQSLLNQAILEVNRKIVQLNTELLIPTTWAAGYIHRYFRRKHHNYYQRLNDGCHPTDEAAQYWMAQIQKTAEKVQQTMAVQYPESSSK